MFFWNACYGCGRAMPEGPWKFMQMAGSDAAMRLLRALALAVGRFTPIYVEHIACPSAIIRFMRTNLAVNLAFK
jgi:hypothetical protein